MSGKDKKKVVTYLLVNWICWIHNASCRAIVNVGKETKCSHVPIGNLTLSNIQYFRAWYGSINFASFFCYMFLLSTKCSQFNLFFWQFLCKRTAGYATPKRRSPPTCSVSPPGGPSTERAGPAGGGQTHQTPHTNMWWVWGLKVFKIKSPRPFVFMCFGTTK